MARTCSGDMYAIVPNAVPGVVRFSTPDSIVGIDIPAVSITRVTFASPKSRIVAGFLFVTKMFAGLMSR